MPEKASGMYRSEDMTLVQLHMQREAAHDTVKGLGNLACVQFRDLNPNLSGFQRMFANDVRRCEDAERRMRFFEEQLRRANTLPLAEEEDGVALAETLDALEPKLEAKEAEARDLNAKYEELLRQKNSALEYKEVLMQDPSFFRGEAGPRAQMGAQSDVYEEGTGPSFRSGGLRYLTGVILTEKTALFERLVFRATRGNMFMRYVESDCKFEDPATGSTLQKSVFVVFFGAARAHDKIKRLAESLQATLYPYNIDDPSEVNDVTGKVNSTLDELERTLEGTNRIRKEMVDALAENLYAWKKTILCEKSIYSVMNQLSFKGQTVVGECWVPNKDMDRVQHALTEAEQSSGARVSSLMEPVKTHEEPPTHFPRNKFTRIFQAIVDSYGVGTYKEANPAVLTIVTFPFLFGVMYGDIGHGLMLTLFAGIMLFYEKALLKTKINEIFEMIFNGRYLLFMMGIAATYMGFLYNDLFGLMIGPFGPSDGDGFWVFPKVEGEADSADYQKVLEETCDPGYSWWYGAPAGHHQACKRLESSVYPIGVDPYWSETTNKLSFLNGVKMKQAVILGVLQMLTGEALQLTNHLYFKDYKQIWFRFIPEVLFLCCTFGYMCVMIIIKWNTDWSVAMLDGRLPPSLLEQMTNFFLSPSAVTEDNYLYGSRGSQTGLQVFLLLIALVSVPVLLFPIPCIAYFNKDKPNYGELDEATGAGEDDEEGGEGATAAGGGGHGGHEFGEVVIHQIIHTIEYVLGCVSHTASYLRLWALSLAHAQLAEVFWNFTMGSMLTMQVSGFGGGIVMFVGSSIWLGATVGVLLAMEALSAFLHALRLHWVEFQSKFYMGEGYSFTPYSIEALTPKPWVYKAIFTQSDE